MATDLIDGVLAGLAAFCTAMAVMYGLGGDLAMAGWYLLLAGFAAVCSR